LKVWATEHLVEFLNRRYGDQELPLLLRSVERLTWHGPWQEHGTDHDSAALSNSSITSLPKRLAELPNVLACKSYLMKGS
jgi:hypothetical protein